MEHFLFASLSILKCIKLLPKSITNILFAYNLQSILLHPYLPFNSRSILGIDVGNQMCFYDAYLHAFMHPQSYCYYESTSLHTYIQSILTDIQHIQYYVCVCASIYVCTVKCLHSLALPSAAFVLLSVLSYVCN